MDQTDKFPRISDEELLTLVQQQTFKYFHEFAHPVSKMARERTTSGNTVTTGGTGFGVMSMIVAVEREFISRTEALNHIQTIVTFLETKAIRYHGAFAHWIHGETGATLPFSNYDNGADLVETSLLFQGLLAARQYFKNTSPEETKLRDDITKLWEKIEWDWRLLASLIYQESGFDHSVESWMGARGLMQLMPSTAAEFGLDSISSPEMNIRAGVKYLSWLDKQFEHKVPVKDERKKFVLAAYTWPCL